MSSVSLCLLACKKLRSAPLSVKLYFMYIFTVNGAETPQQTQSYLRCCAVHLVHCAANPAGLVKASAALKVGSNKPPWQRAE